MADKDFMSFREEDTAVDKPMVLEPEVEEMPTEGDLTVDGSFGRVINAGEGIRVTATDYKTLKKDAIKVSYAVADGDYIYQIELLRQPKVDPVIIVGSIAQALDAVIPKHVHAYVQEPPKEIEWPVFTVIVKGGARLHGAKAFMEEKLVNKFLNLQIWG